MTKIDLIKKAYDDYFERLDQIFKHVQRMKNIADNLSGPEKAKMERNVKELEEKLTSYAEHLSSTGIKIIKKVA